MIEVLKPGFFSSIQDLGRVGYQQFGVPISGVMDRNSAKMANQMLGNDANDAVLEITMTGPSLKFHQSAQICIAGAEMSPMLNDHPISNNKIIPINSGDILSFGKLISGFRSYLAIKGGFQTETVLGSRSFCPNITTKIRVEKGDRLPILSISSVNYSNSPDSYRNSTSSKLNVFKAPEFENLSHQQKEFLFSNEFTISKNNNRMAYQIEETLENELPTIITSLVMPGTVQLTPKGNLIIFMRDCPTSGGYPSILQLSEEAINSMSQKFSGDKFSFQLCSESNN